MKRTRKISAFLIVGMMIMGLAILAERIGFDPSPGWSKGRIAILVLGILIASFPLIPFGRSSSRNFIGTDLFIFPALLIVIAIYLSLISISHSVTSNYYALLGSSFRRGELSLPLRPDPELLKLSNPYDPNARQGIKVPLDLSLYKGNFYLYWGPAPSLILAALDPILHGAVDDGYLIIIFLCGLFLAQSLIVIMIWERFFPDIPKWIVIMSIPLAGLANPAALLLNKPKIYETAIAGGQFFFIGGFLIALIASEKTSLSNWLFALAGALWAFAVGTRLVLVVPVAFMTLMVAIRIYKTNPKPLPTFIIKLIPLGLPLLIGAISLAWYNWARFGSITETGLSYQLAGPYLQKNLGDLFSPAYVLQNLYNYILNPFGHTPGFQFPFVFPIRGRLEAVFSFYKLPPFYFAQPITGFLCATPFTIFAALTIKSINRDAALLNWIITSLTGAFLMAFILLLIFFWTAMRYMEDFIPSLILLSIIGFWQGYKALSEKMIWKRSYVTFGIILAGASIVISVLLALSGNVIRTYLLDLFTRLFQH